MTRHVAQQRTDDSSMIDTIFAGVETRPSCADIGSCINLMPPDLFSKLLEKGAMMQVENFDTNRKFEMAVSEDTDGKKVLISGFLR